MKPRKTFFDPSEGNYIKLADLVDFSQKDRQDTELINESLVKLSQMGGGTLYLSDGVFYSKTITLQSNVTIYVDKTAVLKAYPGLYEYEDLKDPETGEYYDWVFMDDAGHVWYKNSLFHGEDVENIKIVGNGVIDGNDVITKYDSIEQDRAFVPMNNKSFKPCPAQEVLAANLSLPSPDSRGRNCNKMFAIRNCRNVEIGGICPGKDLWYEGEFEGKRGRAVYLNADGSSDYESLDMMLHLTDTGHFAVVGSGIDELHLHDLYFDNAPNMRDTFNLGACRDVVICNIFQEGCSDDVVVMSSGSCKGVPQEGGNYLVRNIIADTECGMLLAGGSTKMSNVCIDNAICLASNKAAINVGSACGGTTSNIHFNCGGTVGKCCCGTDHGDLSIGYEPAQIHPYRSRITHMRMPVSISVGRSYIGLNDDLMGKVENVYISKCTFDKAYAGSRAKACLVEDFPEYAGQSETTSMIQGRLSAEAAKAMGDPGRGRVSNIVFEDIDLHVVGGHSGEERLNVIDPSEDSINIREADKPEGGSRLPAYGFYIRRADNVHFKNCTIATESYDGRYPFVTEESTNVTFENGTILNPEK